MRMTWPGRGALLGTTLATMMATGAASAQTPARADWHGAPEAAAWSAAAANAIETSAGELVASSPADAADFCPSYATLSPSAREIFWVGLLSEVAWAESGNAAQSSHWRAWDRAARRPTFRRGLFQISIESARDSRFGCAGPDAAALTAPAENIACAVRILAASVAADNAIAGAGRYWDSLRRLRSRHAIASATSAAAPCAPTQ